MAANTNDSNEEGAYGAFATRLSGYNDLIMAVTIVLIISLIILPMPVLIVDTMIAVNLGISISLLMLSLYVPSALSLSTFPTLLLLTTLFRLSLNITTTRQILTTGSGGEIVETFGKIVVGGNFAVGIAVFMIITIIQFLVISKGSERVAEVSARFTLDAMPGKQMSIDADMRAGTIDLAEAKRRRTILENESKMYGAMDGAMKFVKGDTIAGLIIVFVNGIGGIAIGAFQKGMALGDAANKYTIQTIGDGLVSQIPSLLISITAGIIVTRVDITSASKHLAGEIARQIIVQPKPMAVSGAVVFLMCLIPGFPKLTFMLLGAGVTTAGVLLFMLKNQTEKTQKQLTGGTAGDSAQAGKDQTLSVVMPLVIELSGQGGFINEFHLQVRLNEVNKKFYNETGIPSPGITVRYNDSLQSDQYRILIYDVPLHVGYVSPHWVLARTDKSTLESLKVPFELGKPFLPNIESLWVKADFKENLAQAKIAAMEPVEVIGCHADYVILRHGHEFLNLALVQNLMVSMQKSYEQLTSQVYNSIPLPILTDVLQRLARENISIRNMVAIFETMLEWYSKENQPAILAEYVRMKIKRYISYKYGGSNGLIFAVFISKELENKLQISVRKTLKGSFFDLPPNEIEDFLSQLNTYVVDAMHTEPVVLASYTIRRVVRRTIEKKFPDIPVLSMEELTPELTIEPLGTIEVRNQNTVAAGLNPVDRNVTGYPRPASLQ